MEITHADGPQGPMGDITVDTVYVDADLSPGYNLQSTSYTGMDGYATAELSFTLECTEGSEGKYCNCTDTDSANGHYECNPDGSISCLSGYSNPNNTCLDCIPAEGCCKSWTMWLYVHVHVRMLKLCLYVHACIYTYTTCQYRPTFCSSTSSMYSTIL